MLVSWKVMCFLFIRVCFNFVVLFMLFKMVLSWWILFCVCCIKIFFWDLLLICEKVFSEDLMMVMGVCSLWDNCVVIFFRYELYCCKCWSIFENVWDKLLILFWFLFIGKVFIIFLLLLMICLVLFCKWWMWLEIWFVNNSKFIVLSSMIVSIMWKSCFKVWLCKEWILFVVCFIIIVFIMLFLIKIG